MSKEYSITEEEKKAIERLDKRLTIEKYTRNIGTPVYISDLKIVLELINKQQTKLTRIKEYADREVDLLTDTIEDYIDDDREGNKDIIGSFKEEREHWRDIQRIMKNEEKLYFSLEE